MVGLTLNSSRLPLVNDSLVSFRFHKKQKVGELLDNSLVFRRSSVHTVNGSNNRLETMKAGIHFYPQPNCEGQRKSRWSWIMKIGLILNEPATILGNIFK